MWHHMGACAHPGLQRALAHFVNLLEGQGKLCLLTAANPCAAVGRDMLYDTPCQMHIVRYPLLHNLGIAVFFLTLCAIIAGHT